jgi:hypothetical protein
VSVGERRDEQGAILCTARAKSTGGLCGKKALLGTNPPRCRIHCGRRPAAIRAEYEVARRAERIYDEYQLDQNGNVLDQLLAVKDQILRWNKVCERLVGELTEIRYKSRSQGEQLRAEIALFERSQDRAARILTDLVKLGIEARIARINHTHTEQLADMLQALLPGVCHRLGLNYTDERVRDALAAEMALIPGVS